MGRGADVASFLLSRTGELKLSDQQVTRLAAIARRTEDRRESMRRSMDSLFTSRRGSGADSSARGRFGPPPGFAAAGDRMREQMHVDLRDALSVLTPDQQATAWESMTMRGSSGPRGPMFGWMRGRTGGPMGGPGMRPGTRGGTPGRTGEAPQPPSDGQGR
jgi:hypothetical protein